MIGVYSSEDEIERVVSGFETCTTGATDFHHREHLTVAAWYLQKFSRDEALERMRAGLRRFIEHHGVDPKKYSEDVTVFWIDAVGTQLAEMESEPQLVAKVNQIISKFSSPAHTPAARVAAEE